MTEAWEHSWRRAVDALRSAELLVEVSPHDAASRAYYAAFHAISARFAKEGLRFRKHGQLQAAVHRDLVHTGRWPVELGAHFNDLLRARDVADYGWAEHLEATAMAEVLEKARRIVEQVRADLGLPAD